MTFELPLLSLLIWVPVLGGAWVLVAGGEREASSARAMALVVSLVTFVLAVVLVAGFERGTPSLQFVERMPWIAAFSVEYYLGVDGISLPLIVLTAFFTPLVVLSSWEVIQFKPAQYMAAFLFLEGFMIGAFAAQDAVLFYVFWEALLIPMFIIIGIWGGPRRVYATLKFFLYTFLGSVFMLVALLYLYVQGNSFELQVLHDLPLTLTEQVLIFVAFLLAFAVKVPMWPVHTWLPDAHVEAPTGGSVILAAIMLKLGGYGFVRFSLPITPDASNELAGVMIALSLVAIVYIGFVALVQPDMKKLIAYSSISHMGFVTLGLFTVFSIVRNTDSIDGAALGVQGAMVQMVSHGFVSGAMFLCVGVMYDRVHSREIGAYGGVANTMPVFAAFMMLFSMANAGLPGTSGFVGEFMVILASFQSSFWIAFLAATTLVLGAAYTLWMYKRVLFGPVANQSVAKLEDVNARETVILGFLAVAVLLLGLWPAPLMDLMAPSINELLEHILHSKIPG